jgi:hypothetical protein
MVAVLLHMKMRTCKLHNIDRNLIARVRIQSTNISYENTDRFEESTMQEAA